MSQTEVMMVLALGFVLALIAAMLLSRFVWNIGQRISRHRTERDRPTEIRDLEAERDQLRASQAMLARKYQSQIESLKANEVAHQAEVSRHRNRVQTFIEESNLQRTELDIREEKISTLTHHADLLDLEVKERGAQIENLSNDLSEREAARSVLLSNLSDREAELARISTEVSQLQTSNSQLAAALEDRETERVRLMATLNEKETDIVKLSTELSNTSDLLDQSNTRLRQIDADLGHAMAKSEEVTRQHREAINELSIQRGRASVPPPERTGPALSSVEAQRTLKQSFRPANGPTGDRADILMAKPARYNFDAPVADSENAAEAVDPDSDVARMMNAARRSMRQSEPHGAEPKKPDAVANIVAIAQRLRAQKDD